MISIARVAVCALACWLISLPVAASPSQGDRSTGCSPGAPITAVDVRSDAWVEVEALARRGGLSIGQAWSEQLGDSAQHAITASELYQSVEIVGRSVATGCRVEVVLQSHPTVERIEIRGVSSGVLEAPKALGRWLLGRPQPVAPPSEREIRRLLGVRPGTLFNPRQLERGSTRILERLADSGFDFAQVSLHTERDGAALTVVVVIDPGPPIVLAQVAVRAEEPAAVEVVENVVGERLGRPRTKSLRRELRRSVMSGLRKAGFYEARVAMKWRYLDVGDRELVVEVDAAAPREIVLQGNQGLSRSELLDEEELAARVIVTASTWRHLASEMRRRYQERGYFRASVDVDAEAAGQIIFSIEEGPRYEIERVAFRGNKAIAGRELAAAVETGHRRRLRLLAERDLSDSELVEDEDRIRHLYRRRGYESADVRHDVDLDQARKCATVWFSIEEGLRSTVRAVDVSAVPDLEYAPAMPAIAVGAPLDRAAVEKQRDVWESDWRRAGYRDAVARVEISRSEGEDEVAAGLVWRILPGPLYRAGQVFVAGNSQVRETVIRREIDIEPGEPVRGDELLEVQRRIYGAGVFRAVSVGVREDEESATADSAADAESGGVGASPVAGGDERTVDIDVAVVARPPGRLRYGVGYDTAQGITGFAELGYANLNRRAQRLRVRGQLGFDPGESEPTQYLLNTTVVEPALFDGPREAYVSAALERNTRTIDQYNVERFNVAGGVSQEVLDGVRLGLDLQTEYARVFDVLPVSFRARDERTNWATVLGPSLIYDGRDNPFNPEAGVLESLRVRYALPSLSEVSLVELNAQHTHLIPLWWDWVFVYSVRVGWVRTFDGDPIVPIRRRFFLGGGESVRGFVVNSLGPYDGLGNEVGGDLAIVGKTELRIPLIGGLGFVLFVDGGGNYLSRCDAACRAGDPLDPATEVNDAQINFDNFRRSAGLGFRYATPVGPISIDYGFKLDRRIRELADGTRNKESFGEFSISVGASF